MKRDGDLSRLFQKHLPEAHIQSVETWSTGRGVPDLNYCLNGCEGWIELKATAAWAVTLEPGQVAWIERRARAGGRIFLAIRRKSTPGPQKGAGVDELWLLRHGAARELVISGVGLSDLAPKHILGVWGGRPSAWDWDQVKHFLSFSEKSRDN